MEYVVFDMEWNQPFDASAVDEGAPEFEIVQIGAVKLNEHFEMIDELRLLIKPKFFTKMHRQVASLTGVHDRDLQNGLSFPEACKKFLQWCGSDFTFITWSLSDLPVLVENMQVYGMDVSNLPDLIDLQRIFGCEIMRSDARQSLDHALEILSEHGDRAHDALNDAKNTVLVCNHIDMEQQVDRYLTRMFVDFAELATYAEKKDALSDPDLRAFPCPWCGETVECEPWIEAFHHPHMTYGRCCEGDEFLVFLDYKRRPDGIHPQRTIYDMNDDFWDRYCDFKERNP